MEIAKSIKADPAVFTLSFGEGRGEVHDRLRHHITHRQEERRFPKGNDLLRENVYTYPKGYGHHAQTLFQKESNRTIS
ncbi:MAG: hypothetical protein JWO03_3545 [Bacteroidetes bacterium]|nr:hypothetical protein [Bacteroidota bacterium]